MKTSIQKDFYRSGQIREQVPLRNGRRHGVFRTWHKNGVLASVEAYQTGLLQGFCRQWNDRGKLLGRYRMVHGTGIQRTWHDNGRLQMEVSTVHGEFCGTNRIWLRDGTLISEKFYLRGRIVSAEKYREAAAKDRKLPRFRGPPAELVPNDRALANRIHRVFVTSLLQKRSRCEVRKWLRKKPDDKTARSLGRFKPGRDAAKCEATKFIEELYLAGAAEVIVPDIYFNRAGDQFADCLIVRLSTNMAKRKAIRQVCAKLRKRRLGAVQPDEEIGETHLYLSLA